jgi:hypothetical protein
MQYFLYFSAVLQDPSGNSYPVGNNQSLPSGNLQIAKGKLLILPYIALIFISSGIAQC